MIFPRYRQGPENLGHVDHSPPSKSKASRCSNTSNDTVLRSHTAHSAIADLAINSRETSSSPAVPFAHKLATPESKPRVPAARPPVPSRRAIAARPDRSLVAGAAMTRWSVIKTSVSTCSRSLTPSAAQKPFSRAAKSRPANSIGTARSRNCVCSLGAPTAPLAVSSCIVILDLCYSDGCRKTQREAGFRCRIEQLTLRQLCVAGSNQDRPSRGQAVRACRVPGLREYGTMRQKGSRTGSFHRFRQG
jgi:hypothetical protein